MLFNSSEKNPLIFVHAENLTLSKDEGKVKNLHNHVPGRIIKIAPLPFIDRSHFGSGKAQENAGKEYAVPYIKI
jgi:hypothetical protein